MNVFFIILRYGLVLLIISANQVASAQSSVIKELSADGAWCWFSDPRAIYISGKDIVIAGWVKSDGSVETASLDLKSGSIDSKVLFPNMEFDDHNNPAFALLPDSNLLVMYTWHSGQKGVVFHKTSKPLGISSFGKAQVFKPKTEELLKQFPRETYTYANPFVLSNENNRIYSFGRWIGFKPNMVSSDDHGESWHNPKVVISPENFDPDNRPYVKYFSDGHSRIHLVYTDGHPRNEPANSIYYCYYENGSFWKIDGTKICDISNLPFAPDEATLVYKPDDSSGRAWNADVVADHEGNPVILYTRHPTETDHRYHYAWYDSKQKEWQDHEICKAGRWFPQTNPGEIEKEPHYFGNMTLHPAYSNVVFLARQVNEIFEIEKWTTDDGGQSWDIEPITSNSKFDNVRPFVPRGTSKNDKTVVLWMENERYRHYTDYKVSIKYWIEE